MQNNSEIESFFSSLNFTMRDLIELLPVGVVILDEKWKIKTVNSNFHNLIKEEQYTSKLEGVNLFSKNILSEKLPLKDLLQLKEGKSFKKTVSFKGKSNKDYKLVFTGSPIFNYNNFQGSTIIIENFRSNIQDNTEVFSYSDPLISILSKISKTFLVVEANGTIKYGVESERSSSVLFKEINGKNINELFISDSEKSLKSLVMEAINENENISSQISYFSENKKILFNSVILPLKLKSDEVSFAIILIREVNSDEDDAINYLSDAKKLREFESFANADTDGLFKVNLHGNVIYWTESAAKLFSVTEDKIINKFIDNLFPQITLQYFETIRNKLLSENFWSGYFTNNFENNSIIKVKIISKTQNGITDLYVYCDLISQQQQKLILAKEEEKLFFKDAVVKSNQMILQVNPNGIILFANDIFCEKFEYNLDEIRGKQFLDLIEIEYKLANKIIEFDFIVNLKELQTIPLKSKTGKVYETNFNLNISTTNTDLKYFTIYLKEKSKENIKFLETAHALLYQFSEAVLIVNDDKIVKVNPKFCELFKVEFESDFFDVDIRSIIDSEYIDSFRLVQKGVSNNNISEHVVFQRKDKTKFEADVTKICCAKESSYSVLILFPKEISKEIISNKNEIISKQFEYYGPFYWMGIFKNDKLTIDYISPEFIKSIGFTEEYFNSSPNFWNDILHPNDTEIFYKWLIKCIEAISDSAEELNYRIINKDGEIVWINNKIIIRKNDNYSFIIYSNISNVTLITIEKENFINRISDLEKLNSAKEKFISIISHDLKSPFTSIVGFSELILTDSSLDKDEIVEYVGHIKDASMHTVDLLNGLLDLTKLQTGRIEIQPRVINANYITNKTIEILSGLAYQKGLSLTMDVDKSFYINADENLIFQVFNNLVANSIKFTPKGGNIHIEARELSGKQCIEFMVKDTGVGIEKEDIDKLFVVDKKFTTLGTDGERGTGLGLSLVKEIVVKHNGNIFVESELNKGSKFIFTLPISTPSILIVDGIDAERILYSRLLKSITKSVEIIEVSNEEDALKIVKEKMPMLIIFEHNLPNMKGSEFIERLKTSELVYKPSLMILTKDYTDENRELYKNLNVDFFFSKPFSLKEFKYHLDKLVGKSE